MTRVTAAFGTALLLGAFACASVASAQNSVIVRDFDGPFGERARKLVMAELEEHSVTLVDDSQAEQAAHHTDADLDTVAGRISVARELQVAAFVEGHTERAGRGARITLTLFAGQDGTQLARTKFTGPVGKMATLAKAEVWKAFGPALVRASPPDRLVPAEPAAAAPKPATEPAVVAAVETSESAEDADSSPRPSAFDIAVAAHFSTRSFSYSDPYLGLRGYSLGMAPKLALQLHWYPAAHFRSGFAANLGLDLRGELLVGVSSQASKGQNYDTSSGELGFGLRLRVPLGEQSELGFVLGYGLHSFAVGQANGLGSGVPDVSYGFLRLGTDLRFPVSGAFSALLRGAFLVGLAQGQIATADWFPHTIQNGVEAELGVGFRLSKALELQALGTMQRYFMSFAPHAYDPSVQKNGRVAGGALDQYFGARAALVLRL